MIHLKIVLPEGGTYEKEASAGIRPCDLVQQYDTPYPILACRVNQKNKRLDKPIVKDAVVHLLDMRDNYANMSFQSSLTLLYLEAVRRVLGEKARVTISNSLSKGLFTTINTTVTDKLVRKLEDTMHAIVKENLPFAEKHLSREDLIVYLKNRKREDTVRLLQSSPSLDDARLVRFGGVEDVAYIHQLPSSRYLHSFELVHYRYAIILRFPPQSHPGGIVPFEEQKLLFDAFSEETEWEKLMNISYAADLNEAMADHRKETIMLSEALHEKKIAMIAQRIANEKKRIILIAGPSSSGKTSFAKRLCIQLRVCGLRPLYLGTDDYFIDRKDLIPDEKGNYDFETIKALDINLFTRQMNDLLAGRAVDLPTFNFITGEKEYGTRITKIDRSMPIVIEGIHGLNPVLTEGIPDDEKFRIYISPLTSINIDSHHRIPTTDARMLRRLVRDYRTRDRSAEQTIHDWPSVRRGEDKWIFPYCDDADAFFNSSAIYELSVLKKYAEPLLHSIPKRSEAYSEAKRMRDFLKFFRAIDDDHEIANNSILREFIGGSILVD
jgi:uridine kinase